MNPLSETDPAQSIEPDFVINDLNTAGSSWQSIENEYYPQLA
jgi:hypothetical protein